MNWTRSVDIYCERVGAAFWAEPVNALTNAAFILAAVWAWRLARRRGAVDGETATLILLAACVGVGSFLFHTFATAWAGMADKIPIWIFALTFGFVALRRFFGLSPTAIGVGAAGAALLAVGVSRLAPELVSYLPLRARFGTIYALALLFLPGLALALFATGRAAWRAVGAAAVTFAVSLGIRNIDMDVCAEFPLGSHFLWHMLNGAMFAMLLGALIVHGDVADRAVR